MRYKKSDKNISSVDNVSHDLNKNKSIDKEKNKKVKTNKVLNLSIIVLPILFLVFCISRNSNVLINDRISSFNVFLMCVFSIVFLIGLIIEFKNRKDIYRRLGKFFVSCSYVSFFAFLILCLYGNDSTVRDFIIDKAMATSNHRYIADWLFTENDIVNALTKTKKNLNTEFDDSDMINFDDVNFDKVIYRNKYEEEILKKDKDNDLYKIVKISEKLIGSDRKYNAYLVVVYDPAHVKLATSPGAGTHNGSYGQILSVISQESKALVAMNAGGFYDPFWNSNGGIPHGMVIKDGKLLSEFRRGLDTGGMIGFNKDNKLLLKRISGEQAIKEGIRDAVDWGPYLIVNGKNQFSYVKNYTWSTSRSVIGQRKDGIVLMLAVDGSNGVGASFADCAKIMERYGAVNAANLDGGTSTALVKGIEYINTPWNGYRRTIRSLPNAWIVKK